MSAPDKLPVVYACIWRATEDDAHFDQKKFEERIPRLMEWLKQLKANGNLVACGGGGFENHSGGLTLIKANTIDDALTISNQNPMNEIGTTEVLVWDVYFAELTVARIL